MPDKQTIRQGSPTMGTLIASMVIGIAAFALAYHFGAFDWIIATWTPADHQGALAQLKWG